MSFGLREVPVVLKGADSEEGRLALAREERVYSEITRLRQEHRQSIHTLEYFGAAESPVGRVLVLQEALFSLADVIDRVSVVEIEGRYLLEEVLWLAADSATSTLFALDDFSHHAFKMHGDVRLENLLVTRTASGFDVVLADFGLAVSEWDAASAPRNVQVAPPEAASESATTVDTDLWGLGLAIWEALHQGTSPYRIVDTHRWAPRGDERIGEPDAGLRLDVDHCHDRGSGCVLDEPNQHLVHRFAHALLSAGPDGQREEVAEEQLASVRDDLDAQRARQGESINGVPDLETRFADAHLVRRAERRARDRAQDFARRIAQAGKLARRGLAAAGRGLAIAGRYAGLGAARGALGFVRAAAIAIPVAAIAIMTGWVQTRALPDSAADEAQRWSVADQLFNAAAFLLVLGVLVSVGWWVVTRRVGLRTRAWGTAVTAGLLAGVAVLLSRIGWPFDPYLTDSSTWAVAGAAGAVAFAIAITLFAAVLSRKVAVWQRIKDIVLVAGLIVASVAAVGLVNDPKVVSQIDRHPIATELTDFIPGSARDKPVLLNIGAVAVNSRGDVAVLDNVSTTRQNLWLVADGVTRLVGRFDAQPDPSGTVGRRVGAPSGADLPVSEIGDISFYGEDSLAVISPQGVSLIDVSAKNPTQPRRLTAEVQAMPDVHPELMQRGSSLLATGVQSTLLLHGQEQYPFCTSIDYEGELAASVIEIDPLGSTSVRPPIDAQSYTPCALDMRGIVEGSEDLTYLGYRWIREDQRHALQIGSLDDGTNVLDLPFAADYSADPEKTEAEKEAAGKPYIRQIVQSGARIFLVTSNGGNYCLAGYALNPDAPMPHAGFIGNNPNEDGKAVNPACNFLGEWDLAPDPGELPTEDYEGTGCEEDRDGDRIDLLFTGYVDGPYLAAGPDGALYAVGSAASGCTNTIWRLDRESTTWLNVGGFASQSRWSDNFELGTTSVMVASRPDVNPSDKNVLYVSPAVGRIRAGVDQQGATGANGVYQFSGDWTTRVLSAAQFTMGYRFIDGSLQSVIAVSRSVPSPDDPGSYSRRESWMVIPGLRDMTVTSDYRLIVARCGQIFEVATDEATVEALPPGLATFGTTLIAGRDVPVTAPCSVNPELPAPSYSDLLNTGMEPIAIDTISQSCLGCLDLIVIAESGWFGGREVNRVRIVDPSGETITTFGFDLAVHPSQRAEIDDPPTGYSQIAGDLAGSGLAPLDVSVRADGLIALATRRGREPGPVLLIDADGRNVVDLGPGRDINGVAWLRDELVVTDGSTGDLMILKLLGMSSGVPDGITFGDSLG